MDKEYVKRHLSYISNAGGNPPIEYFDEDWEPIGPTLRKQFSEQGLTEESNGKISLTPKGTEFLNT